MGLIVLHTAAVSPVEDGHTMYEEGVAKVHLPPWVAIGAVIRSAGPAEIVRVVITIDGPLRITTLSLVSLFTQSHI